MTFFVALSCLLLGLTGAAQETDSDKDANATFNAAWKAKRYDDARRIGDDQLDLAVSQGRRPAIAHWNNNLGLLFIMQDRYKEAEPFIRRGLEVTEQDLGPDDQVLAAILGNLGLVCWKQHKLGEAALLYRRSLTIQERTIGRDSVDVAETLSDLGNVYHEQGLHAKSEPLCERALAIREKEPGPGSLDLATSLNNLAIAYSHLGRYAEAEPLNKRALAIQEKALGLNHPDLVSSLNNLAGTYVYQIRYAEAESLFKRALAIDEQALGPEHAEVALNLNNLAVLYSAQGRKAEAERLYKRALAIVEKALGPWHPHVAKSLHNLAVIYSEQGRKAEAEQLYERASVIIEKALGPEHPDVASVLERLASALYAQGRYAEAEPIFKRGRAIREKALGPENPDMAESLTLLAGLNLMQGRYADAEPLFQHALAIRERVFGPDHPQVAVSLNNLGYLYSVQERYTHSQPLFQRALEIWEKKFGRDSPSLDMTLNNLANDYREEGRYEEAESLYKRAMSIGEKDRGQESAFTAMVLDNLGLLEHKRGHDEQAKALLDRAIAIRDRAGIAPGERFRGYDLRAQIAWKAGRRDEALADLRHAMELAEQQRGHSAGAEQERAVLFAQFGKAFERMVGWQFRLGDAAEAFAAIERSRSRSLLDQMALGSVDLLAGLPRDQAEPLRRREAGARAQVAELEHRLDLPVQQSGLTPSLRGELNARLIQAREDYLDAYRDIRTASPTYRLAVGRDRKPVELEALRKWVGDGLWLEYAIGSEGSYLVIIPGSHAPPRIVKLEITGKDAQTLGLEPGPLTAAGLDRAIEKVREQGILRCFSSADWASQAMDKAEASPPRGTQAKGRRPGASDTIDQLEVLFRVLIPEPERTAIREGKFQRLSIVPDGALALLPFEALVVAGGGEPRYLLDAGPPIAYAPSASLLLNLVAFPSISPQANREPVLTVGDPAYGEAGAVDPKPATTVLAALSSRSRYTGVGGRLSRLPYSGAELRSVLKDYSEAGISAASLSGAAATERGVRYWAPGRRVLHLACHGLTDQRYGNFFGALALTPGPKGSENPGDDGFLTLPEIYELNLKGCELAILSACQTNYGPQQKGEGTWALSRGFLVAGSRRVVASNWLVDDEAAASLVHSFCAGLARAEKEGKVVDHAAALQAAKRYVRRQEKWKSPYYWASMVLIGPP